MTEVRAGGQGPVEMAGRVAVVTGASGGIGAATATRLAEAGATVVLGYHLGRDRAQEVLAALPGSGHLTAHLPAAGTEAIERAAALVADRFGALDVLVNAAGTTRAIPHRDLEGLNDAIFDEIYTVNVRGPFATIRAFRALLDKSGDAVVVNISSISAFTGSGSSIAYCASKAALDTMSRSLARALAPGIRVLTVSPAAVDTGFVPGRGAAEIARRAAASPLRTITTPDDVAVAVLGAVTHLRLATGTEIVVDAGAHL